MRPHNVRLLTLLFLVLASAAAAQAQIYHVAEMNTAQLQGLNRARTAVLLPGGILEQHGPYLPSFSDGYSNEWLTQKLAEALVARSGWKVLIFPTIPLGVGGANEIGRKHVFPGTYAVRSTTLRGDSELTEAERQEDGFSVHAGASETSVLLFLRPDLVSASVRQGRPQTGRTWDDLVQLARAPGWPGYFGSPRLATAARGARIAGEEAKVYIEYALKILDGSDERLIPRYSDLAAKSAPNVAIDRDALEHEREIYRRQQAWLEKHNSQ